MEKIGIDEIVLSLIKTTKDKKIAWVINKNVNHLDFMNYKFLSPLRLPNELDVYVAKVNGSTIKIFNYFLYQKKLQEKQLYILIETEKNGNLLFHEEMFNDKDLPEKLINILNHNCEDEQNILDRLYKDLNN